MESFDCALATPTTSPQHSLWVFPKSANSLNNKLQTSLYILCQKSLSNEIFGDVYLYFSSCQIHTFNWNLYSGYFKNISPVSQRCHMFQSLWYSTSDLDYSHYPNMEGVLSITFLKLRCRPPATNLPTARWRSQPEEANRTTASA